MIIHVQWFLGDNIFYGNGLDRELKQAIINAKNDIATIFGYQVKDPERFGIMELDSQNNVISVEEKPKNQNLIMQLLDYIFIQKEFLKSPKS